MSVILVFLLLLAPCALAQQVVSARSGLVYYAEGAVSLDGRRVGYIRPNQYPQMDARQTLATGNGRAEVLLGPGAVMWLDHGTRMHFTDTSLAHTLMVVQTGSAIVEIKDEPDDNHLWLAAGEQTAELLKKGVYRFDAAGLLLRVYDGEADCPLPLKDGQQAVLSGSAPAEKFDRKERDDFHYWAAYRSLRLRAETNSGPHNWKADGRQALSHPGFGVGFERNTGAARLQYLTATRAGTVYYAEGALFLDNNAGAGRPGPVPFQLATGEAVRSGRGRAEILLGAGVVLRMGENSRVRLLDDDLAQPRLALEQGSATVEVANAGRDARVKLEVGSSVTEIEKKGLYQFQAGGSLRVYGGEAFTEIATAGFTTKSEQMLNLAAAEKPVKFDKEERDALFRWSQGRSLTLFRYAGTLMADWDTRGWGNEARHPQFETQPYFAGRGRRR